MFYTIYKTTNTINNMFYVGKHKTNNINDKYLGSGKYLKRALKKYGEKHFKKEILFIYDNVIDMNKKEEELVDREFLNNNTLCYNLQIGGMGGFDYINTNNLNPIANGTFNPFSKENLQKTPKEILFKIKQGQLKGSRKTGLKLKKEKRGIFKKERTWPIYGWKYFYENYSMSSKSTQKRIRSFKKYIKKNGHWCENTKNIFNPITDEHKKIKPEEIEIYLKNGWQLGTNRQPEHLKGKLWVCHKKQNINKRIDKQQLEEYLNNGWSHGQIKISNLSEDGKLKISKATKNSIWINNGKQNKRIFESNIETWISKGWKKGLVITLSDLKRTEISNRSKNKIWINNQFQNKRVFDFEIETWIKNGWVIGFINHIHNKI